MNVVNKLLEYILFDNWSTYNYYIEISSEKMCFRLNVINIILCFTTNI